MFFNDLARLKTRPNRDDNCVATYSAGGIVFRMENAANEIVARVSSSHVLTFTCPVLTISSSSSSSVSVSEESDSFVLTPLDLSQQTNGRYRTDWDTTEGYLGGHGLGLSSTKVEDDVSGRPCNRVSSWNVPKFYLYRFHVLQ